MTTADAQPSDEDLVRAARGGDEVAMRTLFDRHVAELRARMRARLPTLLRRKVGESDVIQEAYLAAYLRLGDFEGRGDGSFLRWVSRILEHKARDELRRHLGTEKRAGEREAASPISGAGPLEPADRGASPSAAAVGRETQEGLLAAIAELPENQRTVLRMVHQQHLPLHKVAELTGRTDAATRQLYGRALRAFRETLERRRERER